MLKKLFLLTTSLLFCFGLYAQEYATSNTVIDGAYGAKTIILGKATGAYPEFLSADTRYMCGLFGGAAGYVYDFEKDTCIIILESMISGYINENHYVGQNEPADTYAQSYVYYNGEKNYLEKVLESDRVWGEVFVNAVQSNGEKIVTMVYEEYTTGDGLLNHYNRADVYDGKTGKHLFKLPYAWEPPINDEDKLGFGSRGDCISADGAIIGGHSTNPSAKNNWSLAFWDISDPNDIKTFGLNGRAFDYGSFYGTSSDGSLIVGNGETAGYGVIVHYNRQDKKIDKIDTIAPLPSWDFLTFTDVSDDGLVIGYCGMSLDPGTREAIVYSEETGLVKMTDFLYEYYDIDIRKGVDLYTPILLSNNGKRMIGFNFENPPVPYSHELGEKRIYPRARKITARAARGLEEVEITWQEPIKSNHTPIGYNIYRDTIKTKLNETMLSLSQTSYQDKDVKSGKHTYYVEVIYSDDSLAWKQSSNQVQVVGQGVSFPVQTVNHRVDYNRIANIYWGLPSSEVAALAMNDIITPSREAKGRFEYTVENTAAPVAESATPAPDGVLRPKSYKSTTLDYIAHVDMLTYSARAAVKVGDEYYTTSHLGGGITVIDQFNEVVRTIRPDNLGIVLSMVYLEDEELLYCGTKSEVKVLNIETEKIVATYAVPASHLAYVPNMKNGQPGLVAGDAHSCNTYVWDPEIKDYELDEKNFLNFGSLYAMGSAYYDGRLYVGSASGPYYNEIYVYDFATKQQIGAPIQLLEDPAMYDLMTMNGEAYLLANMSTICQPGSLSVCELEDGTTALGVVFQCNYITGRFMLLELESSETVAGYDLYRSVNGGEYVKVNDEPMTSRRQVEALTPGKYAYYVIVKSAGDDAEDSEMSPVDSLTITAQGVCEQPEFTVKESNGWPFLEWYPANASDGQAIIGVDLYRDGDHLQRFWLNDLRLNYIDDEVTELGTYSYRLEVLYEEGCVADKTVEVTLTGDGIAKEPFGLRHTYKVNNDLQTYDVTAKWETPMFEDPLVLNYCNGLQGEAIGFDGFYECWGVIGWSGKDLDLYRDLYLVGMEYMLGAVPEQYEAIIIVDDEIVFKQPIKQLVPRTWRTVMFDQSFPMDQKKEIAVGFHTKYNAESAGVLAVDPSVTKNGKSNIVSLDGGDNWSTLQAGGVTGSWLIGALVVHKRDLAAAKNADGSIDRVKLNGSVMRMALEGQPLNAKKENLPNATFSFKPSSKAPLNLTGFNVYRKMVDTPDEVKLNDEPLTSFELIDTKVVPGDYDYFVGALYADGQEIKASMFVILDPLANEDGAELLNLNLYPNPATVWINVEGEYQTLQIFDFGGRLVRTQAAEKQIYVGDLNPGTYMLHFTGNDARKAVYKVVVR